MDTLSQHTNTVHSVYEKTLIYYQEQSTKLLHDYILDVPYSFSMVDFNTHKGVSDLLCLEMECDISLTDCVLEKISRYFQKK